MNKVFGIRLFIDQWGSWWFEIYDRRTKAGQFTFKSYSRAAELLK